MKIVKLVSRWKSRDGGKTLWKADGSVAAILHPPATREGLVGLPGYRIGGCCERKVRHGRPTMDQRVDEDQVLHTHGLGRPVPGCPAEAEAGA